MINSSKLTSGSNAEIGCLVSETSDYWEWGSFKLPRRQKTPGCGFLNALTSLHTLEAHCSNEAGPCPSPSSSPHIDGLPDLASGFSSDSASNYHSLMHPMLQFTTKVPGTSKLSTSYLPKSQTGLPSILPSYQAFFLLLFKALLK